MDFEMIIKLLSAGVITSLITSISSIIIAIINNNKSAKLQHEQHIYQNNMEKYENIKSCLFEINIQKDVLKGKHGILDYDEEDNTFVVETGLLDEILDPIMSYFNFLEDKYKQISAYLHSSEKNSLENSIRMINENIHEMYKIKIIIGHRLEEKSNIEEFDTEIDNLFKNIKEKEQKTIFDIVEFSNDFKDILEKNIKEYLKTK